MKESKILYVDPKIKNEFYMSFNKFMDNLTRLAEFPDVDSENEKQAREWLIDFLLPQLLIPLDVQFWYYFYAKDNNYEIAFEEKPKEINYFYYSDDSVLQNRISNILLIGEIAKSGLFYYQREGIKERLRNLAAELMEQDALIAKLKSSKNEFSQEDNNQEKQLLKIQLRNFLIELRTSNKIIKLKDIYVKMGKPRQTCYNQIKKYFEWDKEMQNFIDKKTKTPI